jgi:ribosomal protein S18 acetylase RimI-like enzyme
VYKIAQMNENNICEVIDLWHKNHSRYYDDSILPDIFPNGKEIMKNYLKNRIKDGNAVIILKNDIITGYFSWIYIDFHNEKSTFCPIVGHYGMENDKENIYTQLYNFVSKEWIKINAFNHLWMIDFEDNLLKKISYNMGFGSYVLDLCIKNGFIKETNCQYKITQANKNDSELLYNLVEDSRYYYLDAPIFLKREIISKEYIQEIIENEVVFLAWDNNQLVGFINIEIKDNYDIIQLHAQGDASISPLGLYIRSEYRQKGIGKSLLRTIFQYCEKNGIKYIHVDFETANINANNFWPKYFNPIILSVRRTVNKDANI